MSKPSIFSKDYEKKMKQRRRRIATLIMISVIMVGTAFVYFKAGDKFANLKIMNRFAFVGDKLKIKKSRLISTNKISDKNKENGGEDIEHIDDKIDNDLKNIEEDNKKEVENRKEKEKTNNINTAVFSLTDGQNINVIYNVIDGEKYFNKINGDYDVTFDFSPSKKCIVLCSLRNQDMFYATVDGELIDITKKKYVSTSKKEFLKVEQLKKNPKYIWHKNPKFIDEKNIAYVSELPWIDDKHINYLWIYNLESKKHIYIKNKYLQGKKIVLKYSDRDCLNLTVDDKNYKINSNGTMIK